MLTESRTKVYIICILHFISILQTLKAHSGIRRIPFAFFLVVIHPFFSPSALSSPQANPMTEALAEKANSQNAFYQGLVSLGANPSRAQLTSLHEATLAKGSVSWVKALSEASAERVRAGTQAVISAIKKGLWKFDFSKIEKAQKSLSPFGTPPAPNGSESRADFGASPSEVIDGSKKPKEVIFPGLKPFQKRSRK